MDDEKIIDLYWQRSENAIELTAEKYGQYAQSIAYRILGNKEDSDECVNDAYIKTWNSIPPQRPSSLAAFLGAITRNLSLVNILAREGQQSGEREPPFWKIRATVPLGESHLV